MHRGGVRPSDAAAAHVASTSTRWRRCATRAAARCRAWSRRCDVVRRRRRAGHHRASARRSRATSRRRTSATSPRRSRRSAVRSNSTSKAIRGPSCSSWSREVRPRPVHAGAGRAGRDDQPGRLAARTASRRSCRGDRRRSARRAASASACSSTPMPQPIRWAASTRRRPRRALHRAVRARVRARRRRRPAQSFSRYVDAADAGARRSASASTPGTISICDNLMLFRDAAASRRGVDRPRDHVARALYVGLRPVVREYLRRLSTRSAASASADDRLRPPSMKSTRIALRRCRRRSFGARSPAGSSARSRRPVVGRRAGAARPTAAAAPAPGAGAIAARAAVLDETQVTALKTRRRARRRKRARRASSSATCTSTPSGTTMRSSGTTRR